MKHTAFSLAGRESRRYLTQGRVFGTETETSRHESWTILYLFPQTLVKSYLELVFFVARQSWTPCSSPKIHADGRRLEGDGGDDGDEEVHDYTMWFIK